jgi:hypothetical protein
MRHWVKTQIQFLWFLIKWGLIGKEEWNFSRITAESHWPKANCHKKYCCIWGFNSQARNGGSKELLDCNYFGHSVSRRQNPREIQRTSLLPSGKYHFILISFSFIPSKVPFSGPLSFLVLQSVNGLVLYLHIALVELSTMVPVFLLNIVGPRIGVTSQGTVTCPKGGGTESRLNWVPAVESSGWRWKTSFS